VRKLCTGVPSLQTLLQALASAAKERFAGATMLSRCIWAAALSSNNLKMLLSVFDDLPTAQQNSDLFDGGLR
jgi:hypothetical protein